MEELAGKLRALAVDVGGDSPLTVRSHFEFSIEGSYFSIYNHVC